MESETELIFIAAVGFALVMVMLLCGRRHLQRKRKKELGDADLAMLVPATFEPQLFEKDTQGFEPEVARPRSPTLTRVQLRAQAAEDSHIRRGYHHRPSFSEASQVVSRPKPQLASRQSFSELADGQSQPGTIRLSFTDLDEIEPPEQEPVPSHMRICGATGPQGSKINGIFGPPGEERHNHQPCYPKVDEPGTWLRYDRGGRWMVSSEATMAANSLEGWMYSDQKNVTSVDQVTDWNVLDNGMWVQQVRNSPLSSFHFQPCIDTDMFFHSLASL